MVADTISVGTNMSNGKRIVSSSHLVSERSAKLSGVEYVMIAGWMLARNRANG